MYRLVHSSLQYCFTCRSIGLVLPLLFQDDIIIGRPYWVVMAVGAEELQLAPDCIWGCVCFVCSVDCWDNSGFEQYSWSVPWFLLAAKNQHIVYTHHHNGATAISAGCRSSYALCSSVVPSPKLHYFSFLFCPLSTLCFSVVYSISTGWVTTHTLTGFSSNDAYLPTKPKPI